MRRWPRNVWLGFALGMAGCVNHARHVAPARPQPEAVRPIAAIAPTAAVDPPIDAAVSPLQAAAVARSVSPDPPAYLGTPTFALEDDRLLAAPPSNLPKDLQTCPVDPLLGMLAGSRDEHTKQDALNAIGLMLATGTAQALRRAGGRTATRNVAGGIDELLQSDDDQSSVSKQRRPPVLFTLGWKF